MAVDEQDNYNFGQTLVTGAITGASTALVSSIPSIFSKEIRSK